MSATGKGPKRNKHIVRAVERMIMQFAPNVIIRATISAKFGIGERTVCDYINEAWQRIEETPDPDRARRRRQSILTAQAACAKCLRSSERMHDEAMQLLAAAKRLDGPARRALEAAIEADDPDEEEDEDVQSPPAVKKARQKLRLAQRYRSTAMGLLARAESWNARAESWFDKVCRLAGTYEIEAEPSKSGGMNSMRGLTSAQRRERVSVAVAKLREKLEARKAAVAAARAGDA